MIRAVNRRSRVAPRRVDKVTAHFRRAIQTESASNGFRLEKLCRSYELFRSALELSARDLRTKKPGLSLDRPGFLSFQQTVNSVFFGGLGAVVDTIFVVPEGQTSCVSGSQHADFFF